MVEIRSINNHECDFGMFSDFLPRLIIRRRIDDKDLKWGQRLFLEDIKQGSYFFLSV